MWIATSTEERRKMKIKGDVIIVKSSPFFLDPNIEFLRFLY